MGGSKQLLSGGPVWARAALCVAVFTFATGLSLAKASTSNAAVRWCGTQWSATDRTPEAVAGQQFHVVYAVPSGLLATTGVTDKIASDAAAIDAWWRRQDPTRSPRFDAFPFAACAPGFGQLDISHVALPRDAAYYNVDPYVRTREGLQRAGYNDFGKKYLVYLDHVSGDATFCGRGGGSYAVVYVAKCRQDLGSGGYKAATAAHEMGHAMGAVPDDAPHECSDSPHHACDSPNDLMYGKVGNALYEAILDIGRDDYYGHSGSWFDVRASAWLAHLDGPQFLLGTEVRGNGSVRSDLPGVNCPDWCSSNWDAGSDVTLRAYPASGHKLIRWEGGCPTSASSCVVGVSTARTVTAVFGIPPSASASTGKTVYLVGESASFTSTSTDDGTIAQTTWNFGDGTTATGAAATHVYGARGTFTVTVTVTDDVGATSAASLKLTVRASPVAAISSARSTYGFGERVTLTSTSTVADGSITRYVWDFGDGSQATGRSASHTFARPGSYTVELTVTDDIGTTATTRVSVRVEDRATPSADASSATGRDGRRARLAFSASDNYALARAVVTLRRGARLLRTVHFALTGTDASRSLFVAMRRRGVNRWCVQVWDSAGNVSPLSCASIRVLARKS